MELCSHKHDEVCFDGQDCPVCVKIGEISDLEDRVYELTETVAELELRLNE